MARHKKETPENLSQKESFYLVTSLQGNSIPLNKLRRYPTRKAAVQKAKEVQQKRVNSKANPRDFYVLRAVSCVHPEDFKFAHNLKETETRDPRVPLTEEENIRVLQILKNLPVTEAAELMRLLGWNMVLSWKQGEKEYNFGI